MHRIPLPLPGDALRAVNVYAIEDGDRLVLVDSGQFLPAAKPTLEAGLAKIGGAIGDVSDFLVTHIHRDHYTHAIALRREFGMRVSLGSGESTSMSLVQDPANAAFARQSALLQRCGAEAVIKELAKGVPSDADAIRRLYEMPDTWLDDETLLELSSRRLRVISTPGHTQGHVVFLDEESGILFAGDHVLPHITPSIGFEPAPGDLPLGDYLSSLERVRRLPDTRLLPAHGPTAQSVHKRIDELVGHHGARLAATHRAVADGRHTPFEAAHGLGWTRREKRFDQLDASNQMLAVLETKVHLDLLVARGDLIRRDVDGILSYYLSE